MPTEPRFEIRARLELPVNTANETAYEDAARCMAGLRDLARTAGFHVVEWKARPIRRRLKQVELPLDEIGAQIREGVS